MAGIELLTGPRGEFTVAAWPSGFELVMPKHLDSGIFITGITVLGDHSLSGLEFIEIGGADPELRVRVSQLLQARPWPTQIAVPRGEPILVRGRNLMKPMEIRIAWRERTF
jgi:hypothetical protein